MSVRYIQYHEEDKLGAPKIGYSKSAKYHPIELRHVRDFETKN